MKEILDLLKEYKQEQLLAYYDLLTDNERENLINEIKQIDFGQMKRLYDNSFFDERLDVKKVSPLKCITNYSYEDKEKFDEIGSNTVSSGEYAVVIMAGGNASRLGISYPKGCLELNINGKKISLFEMFINQLKEIYNKYNIYIKMYIMTSNKNNNATIDFFEKNDYFGYREDMIKFFIQDDLPILDEDGKILLKDMDHIAFGPNGNGNVFASLKKYNYIEDMRNHNIKYVLFSTVDNALTKLVDTSFIGATIYNNYEVASKTITKLNGEEKDWVFCKYEKKPFMLPTEYISNEITNKVNRKGIYLFREKNITHHLISVDLIDKFSNIDLKYHRAYKKNDYLDIKTGKQIKVTEPNSFKFERFIFDAFYYADDMLLYRVDESEFCPIKKQDDIHLVESALSNGLRK